METLYSQMALSQLDQFLPIGLTPKEAPFWGNLVMTKALHPYGAPLDTTETPTMHCYWVLGTRQRAHGTTGHQTPGARHHRALCIPTRYHTPLGIRHHKVTVGLRHHQAPPGIPTAEHQFNYSVIQPFSKGPLIHTLHLCFL